MAVSLNTDTHSAGVVPGAGSFACLDCGAPLVLTALDELPECPACGGVKFRRASLFEHAAPVDNPTTETHIPSGSEVGEWLDDLREQIDGSGHFVALQDDAGVRVVTLEEGWTRIGRSAAADVRLDDPTVSRRHALLVRQEGTVRVLDDRSLNGVFVNGERVDWRTLEDGDEVAVGRYRLHFLEV
jgi:hypothetical protein